MIYSYYDMIYLLTAIGLTPGGSNTVYIYTKAIYRTTQLTKEQHNNKNNTINTLIWKSVFASYTLAFALQLRKKHGKTAVRIA